nr:unnamed protein product [Callosobruchus analis]
MTRLHDKYGKTLILHGPTGRMIISIDYDFLEFVLSTTSILNKSDEYSFLHQWLGSGLLTSDGESCHDLLSVNKFSIYIYLPLLFFQGPNGRK